MDPEKKSLNFIFPTKYVIPKSLKFSHWPSKKWSLFRGYVSFREGISFSRCIFGMHEPSPPATSCMHKAHDIFSLAVSPNSIA